MKNHRSSTSVAMSLNELSMKWFGPVAADTPLPPPPANVGFVHEARYLYRDAAGNVNCIIDRYVAINGSGEKEFTPTSVWEDDQGNSRWMQKHIPEPRPLYNLDELARRPDTRVLLVEGEKAAEAAALLFPDFVCVTWINGASGVKQTDFRPLIGRDVVIWPDHDEPGMKAADQIAEFLQEEGQHED